MKSQLEALATQRPDVSLRLVDIGTWDSPVAEQHRVRSLPSLWLYRDGVEVTRDTRAAVAELNALR